MEIHQKQKWLLIKVRILFVMYGLLTIAHHVCMCVCVFLVLAAVVLVLLYLAVSLLVLLFKLLLPLLSLRCKEAIRNIKTIL